MFWKTIALRDALATILFQMSLFPTIKEPGPLLWETYSCSLTTEPRLQPKFYVLRQSLTLPEAGLALIAILLLRPPKC